MLTKQDKHEYVENLKSYFKKTQGSMIFTNFQGLNVSEIAQLRREIQSRGGEYKVIKNRLVLRALEGVPEEMLKFLNGPTAIVWPKEPVESCQVLTKFSKEHTNLKIKAALIEGSIFSGNQIRALASIPSRDVLLSQLCGSLKGQIQGLAFVLAGIFRKLLYGLKAVKEKKSNETHPPKEDAG